jgi:hypothetical protein
MQHETYLVLVVAIALFVALWYLRRDPQRADRRRARRQKS